MDMRLILKKKLTHMKKAYKINYQHYYQNKKDLSATTHHNNFNSLKLGSLKPNEIKFSQLKMSTGTGKTIRIKAWKSFANLRQNVSLSRVKTLTLHGTNKLCWKGCEPMLNALSSQLCEQQTVQWGVHCCLLRNSKKRGNAAKFTYRQKHKQ